MAAVAAHPQLVGNAFVNQYYNVLHHSQQVVHRFYTDVSCLTRAECGPEGPVETVYSQSGIYEKIMSVDYSDLRAEIKTVDCQDSLSGSVLVMVTGALSHNSHGRRDFVQTFFLAPQEKGYYVLNDIFRYLDEPPEITKSSAVAAAQEPPLVSTTSDGAADQSQTEGNESVLAVAEEDVVAEEVYDIPEHGDTEDEVPAEEMAQPVETNRPPATSEGEPAASLEEAQGDHPKKSYASILGGAGPQAVQQKVLVMAPAMASPPAPTLEKPAAIPSPQPAQVAAPPPPPPLDQMEEPSNATDPDANGKAIYVKNLPHAVTDVQLEEALRRFGAVKSISIKRPQNFAYAFVEFDEIASARAAVEASPIQLDGKPVFIEEKRQMTSRGFRGGRGRGPNRGGRSGGYYAGGRGSNSSGGRGYSNEASSPSSGGRGRGERYRGGGYNNSNGGNNNSTNTNPNSSGNLSGNTNSSGNYGNSSGDERYHRYESSQNGGAPPQSSRQSRKHYSRNGSFARGNSRAAAAASPSGASGGGAPPAVTAA